MRYQKPKPFEIQVPRIFRPTLWHQEHVMAENRQKIRTSGAEPCACGQPSTTFDVDLYRWLCAPCAEADYQRLRAVVAQEQQLCTPPNDRFTRRIC